MELSDNLKKIIKVINTKKTVCLLAPSFPVDFKYPDIIINLKKIGFSKILELTYAAKLISIRYNKILKKNPKKQYICANCPSVVKYVENRYPQHKDKIINVASPMVIMGRYSRCELPDYKTIFIGPCLSKKQEATENKEIDFALTFKELQDIFDYYSENKLFKKINIDPKKVDFNKLYNDYTKIYPLSGAVAKTMNYKEIVTKKQVVIADGIKGIDLAIKKMETNKKIRFLDILFCEGGCIGGPGINSKDSLKTKTQKILDYKKECAKTPMNEHFGKFEYYKDLKLRRKL